MAEPQRGQKYQIDRPGRLLIGISLGVIGMIGMIVAAQLLVSGGLVRSPWARFESPTPPSNSADASTLEQLQFALAAEVQARRELEDRMARLSEVFSLLRDTLDEAMASRLADGETMADGSVSGENDGVMRPDDDANVKGSGFDDEALVSLGIHSDEVERLRDLWESHELARVTITDTALREGWFFQQPHRAELARLEGELRENLSDEDYDNYLYARGEPNQIKVAEVLRGSSAMRAGMRTGDVILRYDDVRIFEPGALLRTSSGGRLGEQVPVAIDRDGVRMVLYVERGALGAMTQHRRGRPGLD
ncbi:MAG TPA: PDZ domain-containing protein [Myxococcales bacterium]|nr:PDZ domain-containing protein [Myxococcales bacterium]